MLNYRRHGKGPALVFQHGYLGGNSLWSPQFPFFSRMFDVIAPDAPGYAGSAGEPVAETIGDMARANFALLDHLGIEDFCLVGHSMGGMIVQEMAAQQGDRIRKLVLYGTACSGAMPRRFETFEETARSLRADGLEAMGRRIGKTWFVAGDAAPNYWLCQNSGNGTTLEAALAGLRAMPAWDGSDKLETFGMPVMVMGGDRDHSYSLDEMVHLYRTIPNARLALLPHCAHNAHLEKPDLFNQILADFLLEG